MEYIKEILVKPITESDFKSMYELQKPKGGGGMQYIDVTGISYDDLCAFFSGAQSNVSTIDPDRLTFNCDVYVIASSMHQALEIAPRSSKKSYKISRQTLRNRHPAWSIKHGFPEPYRGADGNYKKDGITDLVKNLKILLIKTVDDLNQSKYYASFLNADHIPMSWPFYKPLEEIFTRNYKGIVKFNNKILYLTDDIFCPFGSSYDLSSFQYTNDINYDDLIQTIDDWSYDNEVSNSNYLTQSKKDQEILKELNKRKPKPVGRAGSKRFETKPVLGKTVIALSEFKCSLQNKMGWKHESFESKVSNENYCEAHHLIPMKFQQFFIDKFGEDALLDCTNNIVCLCPLCHRAIHNGKEEIRNKIIEHLYNDLNYQKKLEDAGLLISLDELKNLYK